MERSEPAAEDSLAAMRARSRFGIAMAAMIKIIATTISNSISEKPFCFLFMCSSLLEIKAEILLYALAGYTAARCKPRATIGKPVYRYDTSCYTAHYQHDAGRFH